MPDWQALWAFVVALALALGVLIGVLYTNDDLIWSTALPHLPTTWTFKESWASNVTIGGGVLAGLIGSSGVVKAFLGSEADSSIALATVGAAVAAVFVVMGGVVVQSFKHPDENSFTAGGFVLAAALTLGGAFGELFVMWWTGRDLSLGGLQNWLWLPSAFVAIVLAYYAVTSVRTTLATGSASSSPITLSETTVTQVLIAAKCCPGASPEALFDEITKKLTPKVKRAEAKNRLKSKSIGEQSESLPARNLRPALL